jgi:hypothetical protein
MNNKVKDDDESEGLMGRDKGKIIRVVLECCKSKTKKVI